MASGKSIQERIVEEARGYIDQAKEVVAPIGRVEGPPMKWDPDLKTSVNVRRCFSQIDAKYAELLTLVRNQDQRGDTQKKILVEIKEVFERLTKAHARMVDDFSGRLASMENSYSELNELFRANATFETVETLREENHKLQLKLKEMEDGVEKRLKEVG